MGPHQPSSEASGATATASLNVTTAAAEGGGGDWLASYLVSTRFADDPRLSSSNLRAIAALNATTKKVQMPSNARVGDESVFLKQQEEKEDAAARNCASGLKAAVDGGKTGGLLQREDSLEDFEAWMSESRRDGKRGGKRGGTRRRKHRASVGAQPGDAIGEKVVAEAKVATETSRKSGEGKGEAASHTAHPTGRASISGRVSGRVSMSGRRTSIDYSDLEAIRERLLQAANMWAAQEGQGSAVHGDDTTDDEEGEEEGGAGADERKVRGRSDSSSTDRHSGSKLERTTASAAAAGSGSGSGAAGSESQQQSTSNGTSGAVKPSFLSRWRGKK